MKLIKYILGAWVILFSSCSDFLEVKPVSSFTAFEIYSDPTLTQGAIMSIYNIFGENNSYRNRLWTYMGCNTDTEFKPGASGAAVSSPTSAADVISLYRPNSDLADGFNNEDAANPWSRIYTAIERANLAIVGIRKHGNPLPGTPMGHLLGEALTLRAFFYNDLIKWWGDVPLRIEPVTKETLFVPKTARSVIYDQILSDLGEAVSLMYSGDNQYTNTTKRLSKDAARGLRARIALAAAGYAMHPDASGNAEIRYTFTDEAKRRELYTIARDECKSIIGDGKYVLDSSYRNIFYEQCQNIETHGREAIFQLPYNPNIRGQMLYWFGLKRTGSLNDKYITTSGLQLGGRCFVMPSLYYDFDEADNRKDITGQPYEVAGDTAVITNIINIHLAKWRAEWCSYNLTNNDDGVSPIVLRYADVLLMYAEADLYLGATDGKEYFNKVRRRAFGKSIDIPSGIDKELTIENIKQERAFEFCGENIRKYDLIRWGELKAKLDLAKEKMKRLRDGIDEYADVPQTVYWKPYVIDAATGEKGIIMYGLKRGEIDDKPTTDPNGDWTAVNWTNGTSNGVLRLNDTWINAIYHKDPDKYQLLPITSIIISNSNGMLKNDYGYNN